MREGLVDCAGIVHRLAEREIEVEPIVVAETG